MVDVVTPACCTHCPALPAALRRSHSSLAAQKQVDSLLVQVFSRFKHPKGLQYDGSRWADAREHVGCIVLHAPFIEMHQERGAAVMPTHATLDAWLHCNCCSQGHAHLVLPLCLLKPGSTVRT